jgi:hypothetical protein
VDEVHTIIFRFNKCKNGRGFEALLNKTPIPSLKLALISTDLKDNPKIMGLLLEHCLKKGSGNWFSKANKFKRIEPLLKIFCIALHVSTLKESPRFMQIMAQKIDNKPKFIDALEVSLPYSARVKKVSYPVSDKDIKKLGRGVYGTVKKVQYTTKTISVRALRLQRRQTKPFFSTREKIVYIARKTFKRINLLY